MPIPWRYLLFDDTYYLTKSITWRFFKLLDDTYFLTIPIIWRYLLLLCDVVRISEVSQPKLPLTMCRGVLRFLEPRSFCFTFCLVTADILSPAVSMHKSAWSLLQVTLSGTLRVRKRNQTAVKINWLLQQICECRPTVPLFLRHKLVAAPALPCCNMTGSEGQIVTAQPPEIFLECCYGLGTHWHLEPTDLDRQTLCQQACSHLPVHLGEMTVRFSSALSLPAESSPSVFFDLCHPICQKMQGCLQDVLL